MTSELVRWIPRYTVHDIHDSRSSFCPLMVIQIPNSHVLSLSCRGRLLAAFKPGRVQGNSQSRRLHPPDQTLHGGLRLRSHFLQLHFSQIQLGSNQANHGAPRKEADPTRHQGQRGENDHIQHRGQQHRRQHSGLRPGQAADASTLAASAETKSQTSDRLYNHTPHHNDHDTT